MVAGPSQAATIVNQNVSGLVAPTIIDFGANLYANNTVITNQFSGVSFGSNYRYSTCICTFPNITDGNLSAGNVNLPPGDIVFANPVSAAAFSFRTNSGSTTFRAYLGAVLVAQFTASTFPFLSSGQYYGFSGITFDRVSLSISSILSGNPSYAFGIDNLQFNVATVPAPAALPLFVSGLGVMGLLGWRRKRKKAAAMAAA